MLNEERIKLMTKMALYQTNEGKRNVAIGSYFRGDYISLQVIKSMINATIAFVILFALFVLYDLEFIMSDIYKVDNLLDVGKPILLAYLVFVGVYAFISYLVYAYRYAKARKGLKSYYNNLKKLAFLYEKENRK